MLIYFFKLYRDPPQKRFQKETSQVGCEVKETAQRLSSASLGSVPRDAKLQQLTALGFSPAAAQQALRACGGDVEAATMWLLDRQHDEAPRHVKTEAKTWFFM